MRPTFLLLPVTATAVLTAATVRTVAAGDASSQQHGHAHPTEKTVRHIHAEIPILDLEALAGIASEVVLADVISVRTIDMPKRTLLTEYTLEIVESYLGERTGPIRVVIAGGETSERLHVMDNSPRLSPGERSLLFLAGAPGTEALGLIGLSQGRYAVEQIGDELFVCGRHAQEPTLLQDFIGRALEARLAFDSSRGVTR